MVSGLRVGGRSGRAWKGRRQATVKGQEGFPVREGATDIQLELARASQDPGGNLDQFLDDRLHAMPLGRMTVVADAFREDPKQGEQVMGQHSQAGPPAGAAAGGGSSGGLSSPGCRTSAPSPAARRSSWAERQHLPGSIVFFRCPTGSNEARQVPRLQSAFEIQVGDANAGAIGELVEADPGQRPEMLGHES